MFEPPQEKQSDSSKSLWVGAVVALAAIAVIAFLLMGKKDTASTLATSAPATSAPLAKADPLHDLKIQRAVMDKDSSGTIAVWAISIENKSPSYAYRDIQYETSYLGPDGKVIVSNKGTLAVSVAPQDEKNTQLRDVTYPNGTATYRIRVTSATAEAQ